MPREGYGKKDGQQRGFTEGDTCKNQTNKCRNPLVRKRRDIK